jgi:hypothetical protein
MSEIKICDNYDHGNYKVPFIGTFAFNGAEYWCPYCGKTAGMFGSGERVDETELLAGRHAIYEAHSSLFLRCKGILVCSGLTYKKKEIRRDEIPELVFDFARHYASQWEYRIKASKLLKKDRTPSVDELEYLLDYGELMYPKGSEWDENPFIPEKKEKVEA